MSGSHKKEWLKRHIQLTMEERLLIAGILVIALIGIIARWRNSGSWFE